VTVMVNNWIIFELL